METKDYWRTAPKSGRDRESLAYILKEINGKKQFFVTIDGIYPNSLIAVTTIKENVQINYFRNNSIRLSDSCLESTKTLTPDKSSEYIKLINIEEYLLPLY